MQVSWRFHIYRFRYFQCLNVMIAWRLLIDVIFVEVPCRFHGELIQISCRFHGGSMLIPYRFQGIVMEIIHQQAKLANPAYNQYEPAWKSHGNSMKSASVRVQDRTALEFNLRKIVFFPVLFSCRLYRQNRQVRSIGYIRHIRQIRQKRQIRQIR